MKYAVIRVNNNQYLVKEGEKVVLDKIDEKSVKPEVLLSVDGDKVEVGTPVVSGAKVTLTFVAEEKGEKIHVRKYRAKSRYRKHIGSRAVHSVYTVAKIS